MINFLDNYLARARKDRRGGVVGHARATTSLGRVVVLAESGCCASSGFSLVAFRGGTSHIRCQGHLATIVGSAGRDELVGAKHRDVIAALGGADKVRGMGGSDIMCGGPGKDTLLGGPGQDQTRP